MAKKGLDQDFVHYGMRSDDLKVIATMCKEQDLNFEWLRENVFKSFHESKNNKHEIEIKDIETILEKALKKLIK